MFVEVEKQKCDLQARFEVQILLKVSQRCRERNEAEGWILALQEEKSVVYKYTYTTGGKKIQEEEK